MLTVQLEAGQERCDAGLGLVGDGGHGEADPLWKAWQMQGDAGATSRRQLAGVVARGWAERGGSPLSPHWEAGGTGPLEQVGRSHF